MISRLLAQSCRLCLSIFNPRFSLQFSIHLYHTLALLSSPLTPSLSSRLYNNRDEFLRADTFRSLPLTISSRFECLLGVGWGSSNCNIRRICWKKCRRDTCRYTSVLTSILVIFFWNFYSVIIMQQVRKIFSGIRNFSQNSQNILKRNWFR